MRRFFRKMRNLVSKKELTAKTIKDKESHKGFASHVLNYDGGRQVTCERLAVSLLVNVTFQLESCRTRLARPSLGGMIASNPIKEQWLISAEQTLIFT
jgi:hypothetical protein